MSIHYTLFWLLLTAAFGQSDFGLLGVLVGGLGVAGLAIALVAAIRKPSWQLLWFALPIAVTHAFLQIVGIWLIGDHHEAIAVSLYAAALLIALAIAAYAARANRLAVAGAIVFALAYGSIAYAASLFVFWNGLH